MKKNILIIDDSALMRRLLSDIIKQDGRFHVADMAKNGSAALKLIKENPDKYSVILLDFFMPDMNADELLKKITGLHIKAKVVLISGVIKEDAMEIIEALENGAFDFVTKPGNFVLGKKEGFQKKLLQCIELAATVEDEKKVSTTKYKVAKELKVQEQSILKNTNTEQEKRKGSVRGEKLVALACSTGGPKALHQVVPKLPKNLDAPMVVVQHMPQGFTNSLAVRLNEMSEVSVKEAEDGEVMEKGTVYIARGGSQLRIVKDMGKYSLKVTQEPARNGLKPCADIMYESLVGSEFDEITCVVLTGMGADGTAGIKQLSKTNNIYSIAQNAETCTVYGMPKVFFESGLVNEVLPLQNIAEAIWKHVGVR